MLLVIGLFAVGETFYIVGAAGCWMRIHHFPMAPAILGLILGPLAEQQFRRAVAIGEGNPLVLLSRPLSAILLAVAAVIILVPLIRRAD